MSTAANYKKIPKKKAKGNTDEGEENKEEINRKTGGRRDEEVGDGRDGDDDGGDGRRQRQLDGDDGIDFPDERPPELGTLQHHRVERLRAGLQVPGFLVPPALPHPIRIPLARGISESSDRPVSVSARVVVSPESEPNKACGVRLLRYASSFTAKLLHLGS
ncbi:hypothetical protein B296_00002279 [Ensete ventricosum]|uniref:Uncharacterized protein n=1 Tax=Ensete ventricosum TaxID=4639 RepID=A0A427B744_ENSVE|nr:hypothetical protein B296_00002279 [Ensete ventricosum]